MFERPMERTIQIEKSGLKKRLEENRREHVKIYKDALKQWEKDMKKAVVAFSKDPLNEDLLRAVNKVSNEKPESYEDEYEKAIEQMKFELRSEVELSISEFDKLVNDDWSFKQSLMRNVYSASSIRKFSS